MSNGIIEALSLGRDNSQDLHHMRCRIHVARMYMRYTTTLLVILLRDREFDSSCYTSCVSLRIWCWFFADIVVACVNKSILADTSTMTGYFVLHHWHFGPMIAKICRRSLRGSNHGGACKDTVWREHSSPQSYSLVRLRLDHYGSRL